MSKYSVRKSHFNFIIFHKNILACNNIAYNWIVCQHYYFENSENILYITLKLFSSFTSKQIWFVFFLELQYNFEDLSQGRQYKFLLCEIVVSPSFHFDSWFWSFD